MQHAHNKSIHTDDTELLMVSIEIPIMCNFGKCLALPDHTHYGWAETPMTVILFQTLCADLIGFERSRLWDKVKKYGTFSIVF